MSTTNRNSSLRNNPKKRKHSSLTPTFDCDISYIDEITDSEECSVIKVKIIHLWKTPTKIMNGSSKGENINMLLMDEKVMLNFLKVV